MCNKGGSPPVPNATSTAFQSASSPSAFAMPYYQQYMQQAAGLSGTPFNPAMEGQVAPLNANQTDLGNVMYGTALNLPTAVQNLNTAGANAGTFDPSQVQAIESPFTQDVVNATQDWFNNQNAIQGNDLLSGAIRSGNAFGGDRAGIAQAQLAGQQQQAQAPVIAGLYQAGYGQALNEYNQLKQLGLTGAQAGLQGELAGISGAGAGMTYGNMLQQQGQRELDVAQQNAMMSSAYPFQIANWYGSALGGLGPLTGSFAQGYTTPPPPNAITQAAGIATSLAGLGTSLFGKDGGVVGRKVGGLVPVPRMRFAGAVPMVRLRTGGIVPMYRTGGLVIPLRFGGPVRMLSGGFLGDGTYVGSDDDTDGQQQQPQQNRGFNIGQLNLPKPQAPADAGTMLQQQMRDARRSSTTQPDNSIAGAIKAAANVAKKAVPLFGLLERGGVVRSYQAGGDTDDDDETDDTDTTDDTDSVAPMPAASATAPPTATPAAPAAAPVIPPVVGASGDAGGEPAGGPSDVGAAPAGSRPSLAPTMRTIGAPSVQTIPGLAQRPRNFAERWATNPLTAAGAAMLASRSPYFGAGIGAGISAAAGAVESRRKEDLLDTKPQMLPDGSWRIGNKIVNMGLKTKGQAAAEERRSIEEMKEQGRMRRAEMKLNQPGRTSVTQEGLNRRSDIRNIEGQIKTRLTNDATLDRDTVAREEIDRYNKRYGTNYPLPEVPEKPTPSAKKKDTSPGWLERQWTKITGSAAAAPEATAPPPDEAVPETGARGARQAPAAPAPAAPPAPAPPSALPSGTSPQQAKEQARAALAKVGNDPVKRQAIFDRLKQWKIDFSDLISQSAPAAPAR
jgi:hypothetical protein